MIKQSKEWSVLKIKRIEDCKARLKEYIEEDIVYQGFLLNPNQELNDFERFALQHIFDIKHLLEENEILIKELEERKNNEKN